MQPIVPFWFKQRQCKSEPAGSEHAIKVSGPNLGEAFLSISPSSGSDWTATLRFVADGPAIATADGLPNSTAAWDAAFELFRERVIA
jgi:hypothetical protein